jgi:hypothetical protein
MEAAGNGHHEVVAALINSGATINDKDNVRLQYWLYHCSHYLMFSFHVIVK